MALVMDGANDADQDYSLAKNRSRRSKVDRNGRLAALAKFKEAKSSGSKLKPDISDVENVYDLVDEDEYSQIVRDRLDDDWIVDDGSGYVEDGREIFDEDAEHVTSSSKGRKGLKKDKASKNPNIRAPDSKPSNIRSMFAAAAVKPKKKVEQTVSLNEDDLLGDIMAELKQTATTPVIMPAPVKLKKKPVARNPFGVGATTQNVSPYTRPESSATSGPAVPILPPRNRVSTGKKVMPKPAWFGASDETDISASQDIKEFMSQDATEVQHASQKIEDFNEPTVDEMDVSGIDFDDDFEAAEQKTESVATKMVNESLNEMDTSAELCDEELLEASTLSSFQCTQESTTTDVSISRLPMTNRPDGEEVLSLYWIDAYEDYFKHPGVIYLFGKVWIESAKAFVSCCVTVRNIERRIFLLPRKTKVNPKTNEVTDTAVGFIDVYKEFDEVIADKYKIMNFKSLRVSKNYAFERDDVPAESEYLEVRYSADFAALPNDLQGETFSHVFGTNTSALELFLLDRKIKGPCWLDVKMPQTTNPGVTWCKVEAEPEFPLTPKRVCLPRQNMPSTSKIVSVITVSNVYTSKILCQDVFVLKPEDVKVSPNAGPPPPLIVMTMTLHTLPNAKTHQNEVIGVSCLTHLEFHIDKAAPKVPYQDHFCIFTKPTDAIFPFDFKRKVEDRNKEMKVDIMMSERVLLGFLLAKIQKIDPDLIVGHDLVEYGLDVLLHRINHNKVSHWSRIGRLKRATMPKFTGSFRFRGAGAACGRLVCDVMLSAKELIRCRSYDLTELASHVLKENRRSFDADEIRRMFLDSNSDGLLRLISCGLTDATYILRIMCDLNVIPLALQITNICGNVMSRTLMGGRSERNEFLLLHAFTEKNFIVPDKVFGKKPQQVVIDEEDDGFVENGKKSGRKKPAYMGGLVLEPKKGFYDKYILLLDFNSLYPSIIQEYNICFTTIAHSAAKQSSQDDDGDYDDSLIPDEGLEPGVLPTEIRKLVESRRLVRQMMKAPGVSPDQCVQYDIRQKALKLTANSMYGCLGFTKSRFYAKRLAALVTGKGREILLKTKDLVQSMNLDVIYGDTDSIMVNTGCTDIDQVFKTGNKIKSEVNKLYRQLEIDIDGVFQSMLLLKKKKYAALSIQKVNGQCVTSRELKGLDIVRRDWCTLAKEVGNYVVDQILSGDSREAIVENIHSKLMEIGQKVKDGQIPVDLYIITKQLTKNPEDYPDKNSLPHVQVALRLNTKGGRKWRGGDTVAYVICLDGSSMAASQRGYHPDELSKRSDLQIDTKYYLAQQLHPVVSRLCDPIDGTDAGHIAECLGLDPSGYQHSGSHGADEDDALLGATRASDEERYKECERLVLCCPDCKRENVIEKVLVSKDPVEFALLKCSTAECKGVLLKKHAVIKNKITMAIRSHVRKYYEGWMKCEDVACGTRTRRLPLVFNQEHPVCQACSRGNLLSEYTEHQLYVQLSFYQHLFDLERGLYSIPIHEREKIRSQLENVGARLKKNDARLEKEKFDVMRSYRDLKCYVDRLISHSAYAHVDLGRLFVGLFKLK